MTTFNEALAEHCSAKEVIRYTLQEVYANDMGNMTESFVPVAQWVLDNAADIAAHERQSGAIPKGLKGAEHPHPQEWLGLFDRMDGLTQLVGKQEAQINMLENRLTTAGRELWEAVDPLTASVQALEDAPGPRPNAAEVSALRQRMDALTETLEKMRSLDTSDVLTALVRDVQHIKKWAQLLDGPKLLTVVNALHKDVWQLKTGQSADPQPVATPEPDFNWVETACYVDGERWGEAGKTLGQWVGVVKGACQVFDTEAEARSWVEAQFSNPKNQ
jgi:hypothetical protein